MSSTVLPLISELVKLLPEAVAVNPGLAYLSGLLHDFGYLALGHLFPARFFLFNHFLAVNPRLPLSAVERYMLGVEHWHIGAWVMQTWSMPEEVIAAVRWHHSEDCTQPHAEYSNLVLIANLREPALDELLTQPVQDLPQAQLYATVCHYLLGRERVQEDLRHCGGILLDAPPQKLPAAMINQYLDLKRGGRL